MLCVCLLFFFLRWTFTLCYKFVFRTSIYTWNGNVFSTKHVLWKSVSRLTLLLQVNWLIVTPERAVTHFLLLVFPSYPISSLLDLFPNGLFSLISLNLCLYAQGVDYVSTSNCYPSLSASLSAAKLWLPLPRNSIFWLWLIALCPLVHGRWNGWWQLVTCMSSSYLCLQLNRYRSCACLIMSSLCSLVLVLKISFTHSLISFIKRSRELHIRAR